MKNNEIIIPENWTYFTHRTNTDRWKDNPFNQDTITVKKIMSVVTEKDIYLDLKYFGPKKLDAYNRGSGIPFEIRCLICELQYLRDMSDNPIKETMLNKFYFDRRNYSGAGGQRHHSIPKDERLTVLALSNYDEVNDTESNIIWTIPERFLKFYKEEIKKGNNRFIDLNIQNNENKKHH